MRQLIDRAGFSAQIENIRGEDAYAGMLEGTPYLARRFRLLQGRNLMNSPGHFVHGMDELEREIEETQRDTEIWAPNERWTAKLVEEPDYSRGVRKFVFITWYQQAEDPMERPTKIVASIELEKYIQEELYEIE